MKVAVPRLKHSPRFGQRASSHTVTNVDLRNRRLSASPTASEPARFATQAGSLFTVAVITYWASPPGERHPSL